MTAFLRQNSALTVQMGPFVDDTDGHTIEDNLDFNYTHCVVSKQDGPFAPLLDGGSFTNTGGGFYTVTVAAADLATLGLLRLAAKPAGARTILRDFWVLSDSAYADMLGLGVIAHPDTTAAKVAADYLVDIGRGRTERIYHATGEYAGQTHLVTYDPADDATVIRRKRLLTPTEQDLPQPVLDNYFAIEGVDTVGGP